MTDLLGPGDAGAARTLPYSDSTVVAELTYPNSADTFFGDCVSSTPGTGTPQVAKWLNRLLQQVRRVIRNAGVTQSNSDDDMLWKAIQSSARVPTRVVYATSTTTITVAFPETRCLARVWGAGGGGGGTSAVVGAAGQGGGGGEYREGMLTGLTAGASMTATVGAGGAGGASLGPNTGASGGASSFGSITANGGAGGVGSASGIAAATGGAGGSGGSGGSISFDGGGGETGIPYGANGVLCLGGGASFGSGHSHFGASSAGTSAAGGPGTYPGQGGTAGIGNAAGGPGANGLIILEFYP